MHVIAKCPEMMRPAVLLVGFHVPRVMPSCHDLHVKMRRPCCNNTITCSSSNINAHLKNQSQMKQSTVHENLCTAPHHIYTNCALHELCSTHLVRQEKDAPQGKTPCTLCWPQQKSMNPTRKAIDQMKLRNKQDAGKQSGSPKKQHSHLFITNEKKGQGVAKELERYKDPIPCTHTRVWSLWQ